MENDYLDLSSDISVLQSMLAQEGLVDEFAASETSAARENQTVSGKPAFDGVELNLHPDDEKNYEPELHL